MYCVSKRMLRVEVSQDQPIEFFNELGKLEYSKFYQVKGNELFINP